MPTRELLRSAAVSDVMNSRRSLDHLVGAGEQSWWNFEAERFSRLDIDDRHKLGCLFNWDVARFSPRVPVQKWRRGQTGRESSRRRRLARRQQPIPRVR